MSARFYRCPHDGGGVGSGVDDGVVVGSGDDGGVGPGWGQREGARSGVEYTQLATQCTELQKKIQIALQCNTVHCNHCNTMQHSSYNAPQ